MKETGRAFMKILLFFLLTASANCFLLVKKYPIWLLAVIPAFLAANLITGKEYEAFGIKGMKICCHGLSCLKLFTVSSIVSAIYHTAIAFYLFPIRYLEFIFSAAVCILAQALIFWNGIISVYCTSLQLGIKYRVIGIICGAIPIANLIALGKIIKIVSREIETEYRKDQVNKERKDLAVCKTKYPLLLVHGVFFRDSKYFNYWGRIPKELEKNGAVIYYGEHQSAASVADSAEELSQRIKQIVNESGCEKVNIIAHSKGGLDCRYAIEHLGAAEFIASLTTVNTPHRGCLFADYLLEKIPEGVKQKVADTYNNTLKKLGDKNPDFLAAVGDLTAKGCLKFAQMPDVIEGVFCQSIGSQMKKASNGKFPLNFSYHLVKFFDGPNDGLVAESSFKWGEKYTYLTPCKDRGISHGDMIDLNRENIEGFDIREFYVKTVSYIKKRGL